LPVWISGNTLVSINVVTLRQARLLPGWVTVFGRVHHLGAKPGSQIYSARAIPPWTGINEYLANAGGINRHIAWYTSPYQWSRSVRWCPAEWYSWRRSAPT